LGNDRCANGRSGTRGKTGCSAHEQHSHGERLKGAYRQKKRVLGLDEENTQAARPQKVNRVVLHRENLTGDPGPVRVGLRGCLDGGSPTTRRFKKRGGKKDKGRQALPKG